MAARINYYAESLGESTYNTDTAFQNKVSLTFTPSASKTYAVFYCCFLQGGTSAAVECRLQDTTGVATLNNPSLIFKDATDYLCCSGFSIATFGGSPSSQTYDLEYKTTNTGTTVKIKEAHVIAIELGANDFSATADGPTTITDTNYVTGVTMTQTFTNAADYYVLAACEMSTTNVGAYVEVNAFYDATTEYGICAHDLFNAANWVPWCTVFKITGDGTSNNLIIRGRSSSTLDVEFQKLRIVAFKVADFEATFYDESRTRATSTSATYADKVTSTHTPAALEHIVFGCGILDGNSGTNSFYTQLIEGSTSLGEHLDEPSTSAELGGATSYCVGYRKTLAASSLTIKTQYKVESAGDTAGYKESAILWLQTGTAASGIAFDAAGNSGDQAAASSYSGSASWSGSNRMLAIDVSMLGPGVTVTAMTYGGAACTFIGGQSTVTSFGRVEQWRITSSDQGAPGTGANTLAVTLSGSLEFAVEWTSYTGVHQVSPTEAFNSAQATNVGAADATVDVTTVADNCWVHGAVAASDTSITAVQTTRNNISGTLGSGANEDNNAAKTPAGAVTMSYTGVGAAVTWAIAGYAIRPVAASTLNTIMAAQYENINYFTRFGIGVG